MDIGWAVARGAMIIDKKNAILTGNLGGLHEIIPGFIVGLIVCIIVTNLTAKPSKDVEEIFDKGVSLTKED